MPFLAAINILMVLSKALRIAFWLDIDALAHVIDENPVKLLNFVVLLQAICRPSAPLRAPMGKGPDWLESLLMTIHSSGEKFKTLESVKNNSQVEYANGEMLLKQRELKEKLYCIFFGFHLSLL